MPYVNLFGKLRRFTRLGKEFCWVILGQALAGIGALAGVKLLTRAMDPTAYGKFSLALTATILAQQSVGGPLGQAAMRFYSASREGGWSRDYFRGLSRLTAKALGILLVVGVVAGLGCLAVGHRENTPFIALALLLAGVTSFNIVCDAIQSGSRNRPIVALHQAAIQWLRPVGALAAFAVLSSSFQSAVLGFIAATLLVICSQLVFLFRQMSPNSSAGIGVKDAERRLLDYAWPFASWGLLAWGQVASDRWFLEIFRDAPSVAAYTVCFQLGYYPVLLLSTAISNLAGPIIFEIAGAGTDSARFQAASQANQLHIITLIAITVALTAVTAMFHSQIFRLLTAPTYAPYSRYLPVLAAAAGLFAVAQAASLVFLITARSSDLTGAKCWTAIGGLLMNMGGAYWFGVPGAVGATFLFSVIYLVSIWRLIRKAVPAHLKQPVAAWPENQVAEG
jgi:O-antigen/teichoic acid export membrane protein